MEYEYLSQKDKMPPICPKDKEENIKKLVLAKLSEGELMYLSTISPDGWPVTDCMHYAAVEDEKNRPVFYMFTHNHVRKLDNIVNDKRVSVSACHTESYEKRNETWAFQFMCTAELVTDEAEIAMAIKETRTKKGYEFASYLPLEEQPCIKVKPVFGVWTCGDGESKACSIDYLAD